MMNRAWILNDFLLILIELLEGRGEGGEPVKRFSVVVLSLADT